MAIKAGNGWKCDGCGRLFVWDKQSSWYGSYRNYEDKGPAGIAVYCQDACRPDKGATPALDIRQNGNLRKSAS